MIYLWVFLVLVIGTDGKMSLRPVAHATWQACEDAREAQKASAVSACVLVTIPDEEE